MSYIVKIKIYNLKNEYCMMSIVKNFVYSEFSFELFCDTLIELGLFNKMQSSKSIAIKPNLCAGNICDTSTAVVSNRDFIDRLCKWIRRINTEARLCVVESDSTGNGFAFLKFEKQNYKTLIKDHGVELVDLSRGRLELVKIESPFYFKSGIWLHEEVTHFDFFISAAKIKTHNMTKVSGCLKNLFGCLPASDKTVYHTNIHQVVADVNSAIHTDLCICEGVPAMEGNGPVGGDPVDIDRIVLANDPVACDAYLSRMIGFAPSEVKHVVLANRHGLGEYDLEKIQHDSLGDIRRFRYITIQQQVLLNVGLNFQRIATWIYKFGHLLHLQQSIPQMAKGIIKRIKKYL